VPPTVTVLDSGWFRLVREHPVKSRRRRAIVSEAMDSRLIALGLDPTTAGADLLGDGDEVEVLSLGGPGGEKVRSRASGAAWRRVGGRGFLGR